MDEDAKRWFEYQQKLIETELLACKYSAIVAVVIAALFTMPILRNLGFL